jgi:hypothetical protein
MDRGVAVRRPGVVIIKTLVLPLGSRPSDTRYSQTPIRLPMRIILRLRDVTVTSARFSLLIIRWCDRAFVGGHAWSDENLAGNMRFPPWLSTNRARLASMKLIAVAILVIWVGLAILGFLVKGLLWLAIVAIVLFIGTAIWALTRGRTPSGTS